jgi:hypothetical protein
MSDDFRKKIEKALADAKEGGEKLLHKAGEIGGETVEKLKKAPIQKWFTDINGAWSTFASWLHSLRGSAMVAWLFAMGMGIALLPGIGFFIGIFIGSQLTEGQKEELTQIFANGPKWIQDLVTKLNGQIQHKWSDFTTHFSKDLQSWEDKEDGIKKAGDEISKHLNSDDSDEKEY